MSKAVCWRYTPLEEVELKHAASHESTCTAWDPEYPWMTLECSLYEDCLATMLSFLCGSLDILEPTILTCYHIQAEKVTLPIRRLLRKVECPLVPCHDNTTKYPEQVSQFSLMGHVIPCCDDTVDIAHPSLVPVGQTVWDKCPLIPGMRSCDLLPGKIWCLPVGSQPKTCLLKVSVTNCQMSHTW